MTLRKPTIVLFDMDGTTVRHLHPWVLDILERLDDAGHKVAGLISKFSKKDIGAPIIVDTHGGQRRKMLVHRALHKFRRKEVDKIVEPCPGIYNVLEILKQHDIPMGLVSNGLGKGYGEDILQKFDLARYFDITLFREDLTRPKPYPDPILQAARGLRRIPDASDVIWYIGDRRKDVLAAIAARKHLPCRLDPLAYGLNASIAVLEQNIGVDHIVMTYPDLETKLKNLFK